MNLEKTLEEKLKEYELALEKIDEYWDVSNPTSVVPKRDAGAESYMPRNDSMAAGAIIFAINTLHNWKEKK